MNILYIANDSGLYGANRSLIDMILEIQKKGHNAYVLTWNHSIFTRELRALGIPYFVIPYKACAIPEHQKKTRYFLYNIQLLPKAAAILKECRIQLIHSNASNIDFGAMLSLYYRLPHIWHIRELLYEHYKLVYEHPACMRYFFKRAARVIMISEYVRNFRAIQNKGIETVYNGLNVERYWNNRELTLKKEEIKLLFAGSIWKEKGIMDALEVTEFLVKKMKRQVLLKIAGSGMEYLEEVLERVRQKGIAGNVQYVGEQKDLRPLRAWADIALMCSRSEALGRVTIESMMANVLVAGADVGATKELIRHGENGYLYAAGNITQLADIICKIYEEPEKSREISRRAQKEAAEKYASDTYAQKMITIYRQTIDKEM